MASRCQLLALLVPLCGLASPALAQTTALSFESQTGDYIGAGERRSYTPAAATFSISRNPQSGVRVRVVKGNFDEWWDVDFASYGMPLAAGSYGPATRYPFTTAHGLSVSGTGRGCNELVGRFVVFEVQYGAGDTIVRFAADFEQHCEDNDAAIYGAVRYNSTVSSLAPFAGWYPSYQITIDPPQNGRVTGDGIDCGLGGTYCRLPVVGARPMTLSASPAPGYLFAGWTGACHGSGTIAVNVNMEKTCGAVFAPIGDAAPNTLLFWSSQRGDYIGHGAREIYSADNARWTAQVLEGGNGVRLTMASLDDRREVAYWLEFRAPAGAQLAPGTYAGATRAPFRTDTPGLEVSGDGRGCNMLSGSFTVHELVVLGNGTVGAFAADFEQRCDAATGRLFGSMRFNSAIEPVATLLLEVSGSGGIGGLPAAATCTTDCALQVPMGTQLTFTTTAAAPWRFDQWGEDADCADGHVVVTAPTMCTATFILAPPVLTVVVEGAGRIVSTPAGIVCGLGKAACSSPFQADRVQLSMSPAPGWRFAEWRGAGCGADVTLTADRHCTAVFEGVVWFAGNTSTDVILQHEATGCMVVWDMQGATLKSQHWITPNCVADPDWRISGVADFDHDGKQDLLFQHLRSGGLLVWLMDGVGYRKQVWLVPGSVSDPQWRVSAVGDFDRDGNADLILQHQGDGRLLAWLLTGTVLKRQEWLTPSFVDDPDWRIVGAGDLDRDGDADLFFQNVSSGSMATWLMTGLTGTELQWISPSEVNPSWRISAVADMNDDGSPDLLLQNVDDGRMVVWTLSGTQLVIQLGLGPGQVADRRWRIVGPR